jgi:hypothetical protein
VNVAQPVFSNTAAPPDVRVFAQVESLDGIREALRARFDALEISREEIDAAAKLPDRYASKLLAGLKNFGPKSLFPVLETAGLRLALVEDPDALERTLKLPKRDRAHVRSRCQANVGLGTKPSLTARLSNAGRRGGTARMAKLTSAARRRLAKAAAAVRWSKRRAP